MKQYIVPDDLSLSAQITVTRKTDQNHMLSLHLTYINCKSHVTSNFFATTNFTPCLSIVHGSFLFLTEPKSAVIHLSIDRRHHVFAYNNASKAFFIFNILPALSLRCCLNFSYRWDTLISSGKVNTLNPTSTLSSPQSSPAVNATGCPIRCFLQGFLLGKGLTHFP